MVRREAGLLQSLHHPHIVKFLEFHESLTRIYHVLEFVDSGSLYKLVSKYGTLPEQLIRGYVVQVS